MNDLIWRVADEGFWVGTRDGGFAGTIDQHGAHFYVRNEFAEYLGDYADFDRAQAALDAQPGRLPRQPEPEPVTQPIAVAVPLAEARREPVLRRVG